MLKLNAKHVDAWTIEINGKVFHLLDAGEWEGLRKLVCLADESTLIVSPVEHHRFGTPFARIFGLPEEFLAIKASGALLDALISAS